MVSQRGAAAAKTQSRLSPAVTALILGVRPRLVNAAPQLLKPRQILFGFRGRLVNYNRLNQQPDSGSGARRPMSASSDGQTGAVWP